MINNCLTCDKEFKTSPSRIKEGKGKRCSRKCYYVSRHTFLIKKCLICKKEFKTQLSTIKTGRGKYCSMTCRPAPNKGKSLSIETKQKISQACTGVHSGSKHPNWKGGRIKREDGYIMIFRPNHPFSECKGYVREHRIIMEKHLGRYLTKEEVVHHINEIRSDNRIENLSIFKTNKDHIIFHGRIKH